MIVLLKTTTKNQKFFPTLLLKTTDFQLFLADAYIGEHGIMDHVP